MFWPTQRAKPQSFGATTVMLDSFVKKENIVIRKFIVSPSVVSIHSETEHLKSQTVTYFKRSWIKICWNNKLTLYQIVLQDLKYGRVVRMIQYMSWPDHGVPGNVDDIVKILSEVEDSQRAVEGKKGPIVVVCR